MKFEVVKPGTPLLGEVIALGDRSKTLLGLFPRGAFEDHAGRKNIIAALTDAGVLQGYVLYRIVQRSETVVIAHLCVDTAFRGRGVASALLDRLRAETRPQRGIRLRCRTDYDAHNMWPKLGFQRVRDLQGGGKGTHTLTEWYLDYGHATLFDTPRGFELVPTIRVVMDANIYIDLTSDRPQGRETRALQADWVDAITHIDWLVTPELDNELARGAGPVRSEYALVDAKEDTFQAVLPDVLQVLFGNRDRTTVSDRQLSDARQIAYAVAAGETCYLTRDAEVLDKAVELRERFTLDILHPVELIERLDRIRDGQKYVPALLRDRKLASTFIAASDVESAAERFLGPSERKNLLVGKLRSLIANTSDAEVHAIQDGAEPVALLGIVKSTGAWKISLLRVRRRGFVGDTLERHLLWSTVERAAASGVPILEFADHDSDRHELLVECDFVQRNGSWWRLQYAAVTNPAELEAGLLRIGASAPSAVAGLVTEAADRAGRVADESAASQLERMLWPAIVLGRGIPACLIPIQPRWAKELFDHNLAKRYLFSPASHLLLNTENVYYSAAPRPPALRRGARILWYVSDDAFELRAISICDEVRIGGGKLLFREFRNLGVYDWPQIRSMIEDPVTRNITDKEIMAIRFSHTRLLDNPVRLDKLNSIYADRTGKKLPVQFPLGIDEGILRGFLVS